MSGTNPPESEHNATIVEIDDGPLVPPLDHKSALQKAGARGRDDDLLLGTGTLVPVNALEPVFGEEELKKESPVGTRQGALLKRGMFSGLHTQPFRIRDLLKLHSTPPGEVGKARRAGGASHREVASPRTTSQTDAQSMVAALEEEEAFQLPMHRGGHQP